MNRSPMPPRREPLRRVKIERSSGLRRTGLRRTPPKPAVPTDIRDSLTKRSGGVCEMQVPYAACSWLATEAAHRIGRGSGGVHGEAEAESSRLSNLLHACRPCHDWCHANPSHAEMRGLMLRHGVDPAGVWLVRRGVQVLLTDDGQVVDLTGVRVWDAA